MANNQKFNKNKSGKGKGYQKRPNRNDSPREVPGDKLPKTPDLNDASWYAENPQLLKDSASHSYSWPTGAQFDLVGEAYPDWQLTTKAIPGVFAMHMIPTVGLSDNSSSPVNIAARNIYSYVRHANSGHSNYDSPDLMIYLLAMDSLYSFYSFLVRAYGVMQVYTQRNRYMPQVLIKAMGLDFDDLLANLADFRYFLNASAVRIGSMCVPNSMSYFKRHMWLYQDVFLDSPSEKAQLYLYVPHGFYKYMAVEHQTGGMLDFVPLLGALGTPLKLADLKTYMDNLIRPILTDEDMNIMSGDILKAFGDTGVFKLSGVEENYIVLPQFSFEVLSQIQNATLIGPEMLINSSFDVTQSNNNIVWNPTATFSLADYKTGRAGNRLVTMYKDDVTPEDTMVATRLTVSLKETITGPLQDQVTLKLKNCGSEIVVYGKVWFNKLLANGTISILSETIKFLNNSSEESSFDLILSNLQKLQMFDYHPSMRLTYTDFTGNVMYIGEYMDVDNYTSMNDTDLAKMHDTAMLSMFNVPQMGAWSTKTIK